MTNDTNIEYVCVGRGETATIDGDRTDTLCTLVAQPYDLMTVCCDGMTGGIEELLVTTCQLTTTWSDCLSLH